MSNKTVAQILGQVKQDLDLENAEAYGERSLDPMISDSYLIQKLNDTLKETEAEIRGYYQDYYLTYHQISLTGGISDYDLPSNIAIQQLRRVYCFRGTDHLDPNNSQDMYKVKRFDNIDDIYGQDSSDDYRYMLVDRPIDGTNRYSTKFKIFPKARNADEKIAFWFIREDASVSATGDIVSSPFMRFIVEDVKYKCLEKDVGNPMAGLIAANREKLLELMRKSLGNKIPDDQDGSMRPDNSHYYASLL